MFSIVRDLLLFILAMSSLVVLVRSANDPAQPSQSCWHFNLQALLSALILASILFGVLATASR
jgi:hypothetical protein